MIGGENAVKSKRRVTVLGLGETGLASAVFLRKRGFSVFVSDCRISESISDRARRLKEENIPFELGGHSIEKIGDCDWVLMSPGVAPSSGIYRLLQRKGIPLLSEVEVASWFSPGEVIAVTGTSGKTTVATLLHRVFLAHAIPSLACGNIGNPWIGEIDRLCSESQVVLEVSSFQLVHTYSLHPRIAVLLNVGRNHLDWHPRQEDYVQAKLRLFQNQTAGDTALLRRADQLVFFPEYRFGAKVVYFGEGSAKNANEQVLHEVARLKKLDRAVVTEVLAQFEGLEHRLENVGEVDGIKFVNDSKCTTLEALLWALDQFPDGRVVLLAGGHPKGADFGSIRGRLGRKLKRAIVYGEAGSLLWESWEGAAQIAKTCDLKEAFREALRAAESGDVVLLSPACASFDQFANYQERGRVFKELVGSLAGH